MVLASYTKTDSVVQFLTLLIIFAFVIAVTYLTVRWISKVQQGQTKCSNIEIIETKRITNNKYLQIVRAGDKYILIGIGKDEISMISELNEDELIIASPEVSSNASFKDVLNKVKNLNKKTED